MSTKELSASFMNGLPVQNHSSPILECVSRLPSYRRRSIHPDRPGIDDPYADDLAWFPSLSSTKCREPPNKQKTFHNTKGIIRENLIKSFLSLNTVLLLPLLSPDSNQNTYLTCPKGSMNQEIVCIRTEIASTVNSPEVA
ncbi:unnamed protein product [Schistosoma mattheei]|uniref:Uncharacterized protein n=1 Tax=Schistosoma mattheei TaxID=31246 RepID=A0A3P8G9C6_9TREM|nr:unnamed protein product [Schistosoma mattheei]